MRNRRLTISALALILMTGCGEDSGLNPELVNLVGTWEVLSSGIAEVGGTGAVDPFNYRATGPAGVVDVTADTLFLYDDGTSLDITFFADTIETATGVDTMKVETTYDVTAFEVYASGDILSTVPFGQRGPGSGDPLVNALLVTAVDTACNATGTLTADGDATTACDVFVRDPGDPTQEVFTLTRDGDDMTLVRIGVFDFGAGPVAATFTIVLRRFIYVNDRGPLF